MLKVTPVGRRVAERRTRLVATLGPATDIAEAMRALILAGLSVARLNCAHGGEADIRRRAALARRCAADLGREIGLLLDLQGPKIRVGTLAEPRVLAAGDTVRLTTPYRADPADPSTIPVDYEPLAREVEAGQAVLLSDGLLRLEAVDTEDGDCVRIASSASPCMSWRSPRPVSTLPGAPTTSANAARATPTKKRCAASSGAWPTSSTANASATSCR